MTKRLARPRSSKSPCRQVPAPGGLSALRRADLGPAELYTIGAPPLDPHIYALLDHRPIIFRERAANVKSKFAHWSRGVERLLVNENISVARFQFQSRMLASCLYSESG